ncbi:hypothetical protein BRADI_1g51108v3 [Brachypodium distachyon]|uniref:Uncharacterized protein n=1 Tax=Brachypodium distachyon TaxID=15368 RepID=A0A2K2DQV0_BRADI|nr:hypothetical protein BRADI_1g51108v3 [Brachypodium distachyon]
MATATKPAATMVMGAVLLVLLVAASCSVVAVEGRRSLIVPVNLEIDGGVLNVEAEVTTDPTTVAANVELGD